MLPTELPVEIWLLILRSLSTRDLVFLSLTCKLLKAIAENERMRRQDIDRLFSKVVNNVDRFRHLMRTTGSLIIGDFATTFFTGAEVLDTVEIFFDDVHLEFCLKSWFSFLREESLVSGGTLSVCSYVAEQVGFLPQIWLYPRIPFRQQEDFHVDIIEDCCLSIQPSLLHTAIWRRLCELSNKKTHTNCSDL
jgi:F-box-like